MTILPVVEQHLDEVGFLSGTRRRIQSALHYDLPSLVDHDHRLSAHIEGLVLGKQVAVRAALGRLGNAEEGALFTTLVLALRLRCRDALGQVIQALPDHPQYLEEASLALQWIGWASAEPLLPRLLHSRPSGHGGQLLLCVLLQAYAAYREVPAQGISLSECLRSSDKNVAVGALHLVGLLKVRAQRSAVGEALESQDPEVRFAAAVAITLLEGQKSVQTLREMAERPGPSEDKAMFLAARTLAPAEGVAWLRECAQAGVNRRVVIVGMAALGDPRLIDPLIRQMSQPEFARLAGEAFATIMGVDLAEEGLQGDQPEAHVKQPADDQEDRDVQSDPDDDLPWPNATAVAAWWEQHRGGYIAGKRYLLGAEISLAQCWWALETGRQRQRLAAAYELALADREASLFPVYAPGDRQQRLLGLRLARG